MQILDHEILDSEIIYFPSAIPNPDLLVKFIEETENDIEIQKAIPKWDEWFSSNDKTHQYGHQKRLIQGNLDLLDKKTKLRATYIMNSIHSQMMHAAQCFAHIKNLEDQLVVLDMFAVNRYHKGAELGHHVDQSDGDTNLRYSLVAYLNEDYEGGELEFANHGIKFKPKAGSIIIFPSYLPYLHKSNEIISGHKYMCPGFWVYNKV